jgi:hypothetical protein
MIPTENPYAPPRSDVADLARSESISLYSPRQIYTAAFLCGPLAGAWLISRNFDLLSRSSESRTSLLVGVAVVVGLFPLIFVLPKNMPNVVIPITYSYLFYNFAQRRFTANADTGISYRKGWRSWLNVIGIGLAWLAATFLVWVGAWMLMAQFLPDVLPK